MAYLLYHVNVGICFLLHELKNIFTGMETEKKTERKEKNTAINKIIS